ncbi:MAG: hypothetical protein QNJ94_20285 [Alphaproteobacteria bacterium]|nr:hypothetical protein [Alphaproteobacteria bacterium]
MADLPSFHDANLLGIEIKSDDQIWVLLRTVDQRSMYLCLEEVERFAGSNFLEGNIVLDVEVQPAESINEQRICDLFDFDLSFDRDKVSVDRLVSRLRSSDLKLILIDPTYGFGAACICKHVSTRDA